MTSPNNPLTTLGFINAGHFFTHLFMLLYATVILSFDGVMALSYGNLLSLALPGFILFGAGALPAGWLGDRWSARGMMAVFFFGAGLSSVATGLARSPGEIAVGLCAIGLFCSIYHPVGTAWLIRVARRRGRALGLNGVFGNMGIAFAATVAGSLATLIHWRAAFIVPGVLSILIGAGFLLMVRSERGASLDPSKKYGHPPVPAGMWRVFAVLAVTALLGGIVFQGTAVALPKLFDDRMGTIAETALGVGGLVTLVYALGSIAQVVVGFMMDRYPLKPMYLLLNVVQVPLLLLAMGYSGLPLLAAIQIMVFFSMGAVPLTDMLVAHYTPESWRGTAYGAKFVLGLGVSAVGVPMVGLMRDHTGGFSALLGTFAVLIAVVTLAALFLPRGGPVSIAETAPTPTPGGREGLAAL